MRKVFQKPYFATNHLPIYLFIYLPTYVQVFGLNFVAMYRPIRQLNFNKLHLGRHHFFVPLPAAVILNLCPFKDVFGLLFCISACTQRPKDPIPHLSARKHF